MRMRSVTKRAEVSVSTPRAAFEEEVVEWGLSRTPVSCSCVLGPSRQAEG